MDQKKRKRLQVKARVRKFRALGKAANRQNSSSSSATNSGLDSDVTRRHFDASGVLEDPVIAHEGESDETGIEGRDAGRGESAFENARVEHEDESQESDSDHHSPDTNAESEETDANISQEERSESEEIILYSSDGEEIDDDINQDYATVQRLRAWAINGKIEQVRVDELLEILRQQLLPDLPKSAKTFLSTSSAKYTIENMEDCAGYPGEFVYFGLKSGLEACVDPKVHPHDFIQLKFSIDGLPLTKSGDLDFWPHLCQIHLNPDIYNPFPVSIFCRKSKPASTDVYFEKFVDDLNTLLRDGIDISGKHFSVHVKCFVCDTPARAFCKNTVRHTAKYACERCIVKGTKKDVGSTVYPSANSPERSDQSFRNQTQNLHHNVRTKLLHIVPNIDMISTFVLDFMHLCCLRNMKRLIDWWIAGDLKVRLGTRMRDLLSDRMELLKSQVPCEFQRKAAPTKKYAKWKATQFYFFLLNCGPIVLKNILSNRLFHGACRILCCGNECLTYNKDAKQYLRAFCRMKRIVWEKI